MKMKILLIISWLMAGSLSAADRWGRIIVKKSVLTGSNGESVLRRGKIIKLTKSTGNKYQVEAELDGKKFSGTVPASTVERVYQYQDEFFNKAQLELRKLNDGWIEYLGKMREPERMNYFYEQVVRNQVYNNLVDKSLGFRDDLPVVDSVKKVRGLKDGDVVWLEGVRMEGPENAGVLIFNDLYNTRNCGIYLIGQQDNQTRGRGRKGRDRGGRNKMGIRQNYKQLVCYRPNARIPEKVKDKTPYAFEELKDQACFIRKEGFVSYLKAGKTIRFKCPKCQGSGKQVSASKRERKCLTCQGKGLQKAAETFKEIEQAFREKSP